MAYDLPDGFDSDSSDWSQFGGVDDIAAEQGWATWADIIAEEGDYDDMNIRPGVYVSAQDAIFTAYDVGILSFSRIVYSHVTEYWQLIVEADS